LLDTADISESKDLGNSSVLVVIDADESLVVESDASLIDSK
jgi:hypothetical protein